MGERAAYRVVQLPGEGLSRYKGELAEAGLPADDLSDTLQIYQLEIDGDARGWAALEPKGQEALLRSVVVPRRRRGGGLGRAVVSEVVGQAQSQGIRRLWLLTTDAAEFFERLGFRAVSRGEAPAATREMSQFAMDCCSNAVFMVRDLSTPS